MSKLPHTLFKKGRGIPVTNEQLSLSLSLSQDPDVPLYDRTAEATNTSSIEVDQD